MLGTSMANSRRRRLLFLGEGSGYEAAEFHQSNGTHPSEPEVATARFFKECGGRPPLKLYVSDSEDQEPSELQVNRPFAVVGRSEQCDIQLPDADVSRRHAYLQIIDGRVFYCDLASRNGIYWNGERKRIGWLDGQGSLQIGPYSLWLPDNSAADSQAEFSDRLPTLRDVVEPSTGLTPTVYLEFLNARNGDCFWPINRDVTLIGRASGCKLHLSDQSVSSIHAAIVRRPSGLWMIDLLGHGGTFLDGERVGHAALSDGQEIRIGKFLFGVNFGQPAGVLADLQANGEPLSSDRTDTALVTALQEADTAITRGRPAMPLDSAPTALNRNDAVPQIGENTAGRAAADPTDQATLSGIQRFAESQQQAHRETSETLRRVLKLLGDVQKNQQQLMQHVLQDDQAASPPQPANPTS